MKASEHLGRILKRVKDTHWGKGSFVVEVGEHPKLCLLGLMHWTSEGDSVLEDPDWTEEIVDFEKYGAFGYLGQAIDGEPLPEELLGDSESPFYSGVTWGDDIADFNDYEGTTREDIIRVVEKAMVLAKINGD